MGELCDAGLVCVFDRNGLTTYEEKNFLIEGKTFTKDERDKKTKLYPLSLLRKVDEKNYANLIIDSVSSTKKEKREKEECQEILPEFVQDGEFLPVVTRENVYQRRPFPCG